MKKILYFVAVLSAFMTSCNSENEIIDSKPTKVTSTITATFDQPATRVQMGTSNGTNTPLQWNAGDQVKVYNLTTGNSGIYQTASSVVDGATTATFEFATNDQIISEEAHFAAYPAQRIYSNSFRYQTTQTYTENSFDRLAMPMVASNASGTEFSFKAQAAVLRLKVSTTASDVTVSSIDIESASMALTGDAAPNMTLGTYGVPTTNPGNKVTLNCATPVAINGTPTEFNIVVPGQTYPSGDLTITVRTNKGKIAKTSKAEATFAAGKVYNLNISGNPVAITPEDGVLTFTASDGTATFKYRYDGLQYQTMNQEWTPYTPYSYITIGKDQFVQFKAADGKKHANGASFEINGDVEASGSVMSLLGGQSMTANAFRGLFKDCTGLKTAPELPATTLANYCYQEMFMNCTSLETAPELPATTLKSNCYNSMFMNCTSLTTAPELPAETLVTNCYANMFNGCSSLCELHVSFTMNGSWTASRTTGWLEGVADMGAFYCPESLEALLESGRGGSTVPEYWEINP